MAPRRPTRLLEYANKSSAYPRELLANFDSGELTLIDNTGNEVATNPLSTETSGTGNAVKEITVNGRKIIITKATYLTEHPTIPTSADGTDTAANPGFSGTFNVVSTVTRDSNGHVTQIKTKTVTMPSQPTSVSGNAGSADKLKTARTIALSGDVSGSVSFDGSANKTINATLANSGVTADSYGPSANSSPAHGESFVIPEITVDAKGRVTGATERTITLPSAASSVTGNAGTADKLKTARTISLRGGATGSTTFDGSADATINVTALDGSKITGTVPLSSIPKGAQERMVPVANDTARLALTTEDVQNGDVIKVTETGLMYYVADETQLGTEAAFAVFTAGAASSVPWSGVTNKPTFAAVATSGNYNDLSNKPTIPSAGTTTPKVAGTASAGSASTYSRSDHVHPVQTSVSGNAGSADKLKTARTIALSGDVSGSTSFDGSANKTISATLASSGVTAGDYGPTTDLTPAHGSAFNIPSFTVDAKGRVTAAGTHSVTLPAAPTSVSGNAGSADKLKTARTISLTGDATGSTSFDGSKNVSIEATLANSGVTADSYGPTENKTAAAGDSFVIPQVTVDAKGRVTDVTERTITLPATPGSVGTADKLSAARTIALSGDASGSTSFDGSKNVTINVTLTNSGVTAGSYGPSANASPAHGASFSVPQVTVDAKGRVTGATSRTITMPAVSHPTIPTTADGTDTAVSPGFGGNFSVVSTVTRDANGHVTQIKTKSVTLPAAPTSVSGNAGTANKLKTARTISLSGGATGSASFDGSANTTINVTSIDGSKITGEIPLSSIPKGAQERLVPVTNMTAMLDLTSSDVQNGDVVKLEDTGVMYYVIDDTNLGTEAAFSVFTAGAASSVPWTGVTGKPTFATVATSGSYNDLSNKPTIPSAGTTTPNAAGTASAGSASTYSRSDHTHPAQTTISGNAGSATKLAAAKNIALTGDVTGSASFDGSADASISATLASSGVTAGSYGPTANASPAHGGTFTVPQVTVDAKGRVTSAASRTITMPAVSHPTISTSSDTTSTASPGSAGTFTAVDSVTRDSNGHVTKVNTKTVTMPTSPTLSSLGGASTKLYTATIGTSWSGSAAPYTQSITVSGILASDTPIVDVNLSSITYANKDAVLEAYAKVYRITTAANSITVYADEKTTTSIPIQLKVIR